MGENHDFRLERKKRNMWKRRDLSPSLVLNHIHANSYADINTLTLSGERVLSVWRHDKLLGVSWGLGDASAILFFV